MINNICSYLPRTLLMIDEIMTCLNEGRKILVLSDRREHLKTIKEQLELNFKNNNLTYDVGYYLGGMKEKDLKETEKKNVILGTFSMASEGFDCKYPLDTIFLGSPKSNIEQSIGRILRQEAKDRKYVPLIIDIVDNFSLFAKQKMKRIKFYQKNNYNIKVYDKYNTLIESDFSKKNKKKKDVELTFLD